MSMLKSHCLYVKMAMFFRHPVTREVIAPLPKSLSKPITFDLDIQSYIYILRMVTSVFMKPITYVKCTNITRKSSYKGSAVTVTRQYLQHTLHYVVALVTYAAKNAVFSISVRCNER